MNAIRFGLFSLFFFSVFSAHAQYTDVINSNRPGVSQSAFAVGPNVIQFEAGPYIISEKHSTKEEEMSGFGADFAIRYGLLLEPLEINMIGTYQNDILTKLRGIDSEEKRSNFKRFSIGAKYMVYDPYTKRGEEKPNLYSWKANHSFQWRYLIPAVGVYAAANIDSKNNPYTEDDVEGFSPTIGVISQNNFSGGWVFIVNLLMDRIGSEQSDFQYILTLTHSFNPQWVIFAETQGIKSDFYADNLIRFGGAYLWNKDFQLDTALTFNTKDTPSVFSVNLGISYRLDFHTDTEIDNNNSVEDADKRKPKGKKKKKEADFDEDDGGL